MTTGAQRSSERQKRNVQFLAKLYGDLPWGAQPSRQVLRSRERRIAKEEARKARRAAATAELSAIRSRRKADG
jgi:hypothetical protein